MTEDEKLLFTADFGMVCGTLFNYQRTIDRMFADGKNSKDLFDELSVSLDRLGELVYKEEWAKLKLTIITLHP
jgi:hypothetical protein